MDGRLIRLDASWVPSLHLLHNLQFRDLQSLFDELLCVRPPHKLGVFQAG